MHRLLMALCGVLIILGLVANPGVVITATEGSPTKTASPTRSETPKREIPGENPGAQGPMELRSVDPAVGDANQNVVVKISGRNLRPTTKLFLELGGVLVDLKEIRWDNATKMYAVVPAGIRSGTYDVIALVLPGVTVTSVDQLNNLPGNGLISRLPNGYTAIGGGPKVLSVDPKAGLNTEPNVIRVEGYNFADNAFVTLGTTVLESPSKPGEGPKITGDLPEDDDGDAGTFQQGGDKPIGRPDLPSRIYAVVPAGFTPGLHDVSVTNPGRTGTATSGPCTASSTPCGPSVPCVAGSTPCSPTGAISGTGTLTQAYAVLSPTTLDLSVNENSISFDPPSGRVGDTVDLLATINRRGGTMGPIDVQVRFSIGESANSSNTVIGTVVMTGVMSNTSVLAKVPFNTTGLTGTVPIVVTVDPNNQYPDDFIKRNNTATRRFKLLPNGEFDIARPVIASFTINNGASTTPTTTVQLNIAATDEGTGLNSMFIVERRYSSSSREWGFPSRSGWIPFSSPVSYILSSGAGTRVLQVWVSDSAGNISRPARAQIDLLPATTSINKGQVHVFTRDLAPGDVLTANLTTLTGDADLLLFGPRHKLVAASGNYGTGPDTITFTATQTGTYLLEVEGSLASTYSLTINVTKGSGTTSVTADPAPSIVGKAPRDVPVVGMGDDIPTDAYALPLDDRGPNGGTVNLPAVRKQ